MIKISGTETEIDRIKSALWSSGDCPLCNNPSKQCLQGLKNCNNIDIFYKCINENIIFEKLN